MAFVQLTSTDAVRSGAAVAADTLDERLVRFGTRGDDDAHKRWAPQRLADLEATGGSTARDMLVISAGSDRGAFSAGLLTAWSVRGDRPDFAIVTGVSVGALVAPFAFLGPAQDGALRAIWGNLKRGDVLRPRLLEGLLGGPGFADAKPLQALIARYVTDDLLRGIALEHARGRRLLILTTDLDSQRGAIWDMGAIASSSAPTRLALFRQVLLASASIPGAFPPVLIDTSGGGNPASEMHVDGGTISRFFLLPSDMLAGPDGLPMHGARVVLLFNGRLATRFEVVRPRALSVLSRGATTLGDEQNRLQVDALRAQVQERGGILAVCAMDGPAEADRGAFLNARRVRRFLESGEKAAVAGGCIDSAPLPSFETSPALR